MIKLRLRWPGEPGSKIASSLHLKNGGLRDSTHIRGALHQWYIQKESCKLRIIVRPFNSLLFINTAIRKLTIENLSSFKIIFEYFIALVFFLSFLNKTVFCIYLVQPLKTRRVTRNSFMKPKNHYFKGFNERKANLQTTPYS